MKKLAVTLAVGAASLLSLGAAVTIPTTAQAQPAIVIQTPPPPPRVERVPPPRRGYVWAPGHYEWRGGRHVWVRGDYVRARPGYAYRAPEWRERDGRWEYNRGRWDRDRDGVPNRIRPRPRQRRRAAADRRRTPNSRPCAMQGRLLRRRYQNSRNTSGISSAASTTCMPSASPA